MGAVLRINRCKTCRLWRGPKRHRACVCRLKEAYDKAGNKRLVQTLETDPKTTQPGPRYQQETKPNDVCKYYMPKPPPYRHPGPVPLKTFVPEDDVTICDVNLIDTTPPVRQPE